MSKRRINYRFSSDASKTDLILRNLQVDRNTEKTRGFSFSNHWPIIEQSIEKLQKPTVFRDAWVCGQLSRARAIWKLAIHSRLSDSAWKLAVARRSLFRKFSSAFRIPCPSSVFSITARIYSVSMQTNNLIDSVGVFRVRDWEVMWVRDVSDPLHRYSMENSHPRIVSANLPSTFPFDSVEAREISRSPDALK